MLEIGPQTSDVVSLWCSEPLQTKQYDSGADIDMHSTGEVKCFFGNEPR